MRNFRCSGGFWVGNGRGRRRRIAGCLGKDLGWIRDGLKV